jgi:hypothetical protein
MAAPLPTIIILALGAAALGGPDALRVLLEFTGQNPCLDIAICIFLMFMVTAYLLGAVLLVRFVRDARPGDAAGAGGGAHQGHGAAATATDCLAQVSLLVSVCAGFLVAACLIALPPSVPFGGLGTLSFLTYFDGKNSFVAVIAAAAVTAVRCTRPVLCFVRRVGNAGDGATGARFSRTIQTLCFIFIALLLAGVSSAASGGLNLDAQRLFPGFPFRTPITYVPVGVAIAAVAGTALAVRFSRRVRNAAGAAAPTSGPPSARGGGASAT